MSPRISKAIGRYADSQSELREVTAGFVASITEMLDDAGINYLSVTGRTKSVESFAGKVQRLRERERTQGAEPVDPLAHITDQVGVRVITYVASDVEAVAELVADKLTVLDDRDLGQENASEGRFGYASRHLLVSRDTGDDVGYVPQRCASVQVRTVLQHAWAEFEHDIRYKGTVPEQLAPDLDRRFTLAAGLLELADREFSTIRDSIQAGLGAQQHPDHPDDPRFSPQELTAFLSGRYASAGWSRTDHYEWISGLLLELGIASLDELADELREVDTLDVTERMAYRYPAGAVRRLDDDLLEKFGECYLDLQGNAHRREALEARLAKLRG